MPKRYGWIIFGMIIAMALLPLALDWLVIGNNFPSNVSNSEWVGFLGSYVGSVVGAVVSLVGIIITIRYTNGQNREDRELQVRPYCIMQYVATPPSLRTTKTIGYYFLGCEPKENNGPRYQSVIYIKNIGFGPAIEFEILVDDVEDGRKHYPILCATPPEVLSNMVDSLQPGEEAAFHMAIYFNFDPIPQEDIIVLPNAPQEFGRLSESTMNKYKNFDINITVRYCDMYLNRFEQKIVLTGNMYNEISAAGKAKHKCNVCLQKITNPLKIGRHM